MALNLCVRIVKGQNLVLSTSKKHKLINNAGAHQDALSSSRPLKCQVHQCFNSACSSYGTLFALPVLYVSAKIWPQVTIDPTEWMLIEVWTWICGLLPDIFSNSKLIQIFIINIFQTTLTHDNYTRKHIYSAAKTSWWLANMARYLVFFPNWEIP
jgi:hypothetical protein